MDAVEQNGYELKPHPAYSPDLAPSNFFLFPNLNKSTASGAIYARSSVIFPHCMAFVGEVDAVKRGPKLNLIKKFGERGGEPYNSNCELSSK